MSNDDQKIPIVDMRDKAALLKASSPDIRELSEEERKSLNQRIEEEKAKQGIVEFTDEEIKSMPKTFRRLIIIQKKRCRLRTHASGKNSTTYEIRFRRDGYDISASGVTIELAKQNFIEKLKTAKPKATDGSSAVPATFHSFATYYFENFRREKVAAETYEKDLARYKKYLQPHFKEIQIKKITPSACKTILDEVKEQGKGKTADELYTIMNAVFNAAITHRLIEFNPLATILHIQHDREEGKALSPQDEETLLAWLPTSDCSVELALMLFCGLRPNEVENKKNPPQLSGEFVKSVNSKRHFKDKTKIEFKFIPICERLRPYISDKIVIRHSAKSARRRLQAILPDYTLKDLRTTFYTKCQMLGIAEPALKEFMGHSFGKLGNTYSDLTQYGGYLLEEGMKLNKW